MIILSFIFIVIAGINIIMGIIEWIETGENQFNKIAGWFCAILFCINNSLK